ncbi:uncharacterized protein LOC144782856 [Lissotriton helveticus]
MPRRIKMAEDYVLENKDFMVEEVRGQKMLICRFCRVTVPIVSGKTASRIAEHFVTKTHLKLKEPPNSDSLCQMSLAETMTRFKRKREEEKDVAHEFVRALVQSGTSLHQADGPIGNLFRKRAPAFKTLPKTTQMYEKYLPEVFLADIEHISELLQGDVKISVTIDETPEMRGDPAVAVVITFCDAKNGWHRRTIMADLDVLETCNAVSLGMLLQRVLTKFNKDWSDIVCICSDSATYMKKLCDDLSKAMPELKCFPVRDPCHLLDGMLKAALQSSELMKNAIDFVVHSGALFRYARELKRKYFSFCVLCGSKERIIPTVSFSRWFSVLEAVNAILSMWRPLTEFLLSDDAKGKKCEDLRVHIDSDVKKSTLYCILRFLQENMTAVVDIIKKLESENTLVYQVFSIIGVDVKHLLESRLDDTFSDFGTATCSLLECLPLGKQRSVEDQFRKFYFTMHEKWLAMMHRNVPSPTMAFEVNEASLWYAAQVLDPFRRGEFSPDFSKYSLIFDRFNTSEGMCTQFNAYVAEPVPENVNLEVHQYWHGKLRQWPELASCVLAVLALPVSSANVERAFSQIKVYMGRKERARMTKESLKKYCMVYYNKFDL